MKYAAAGIVLITRNNKLSLSQRSLRSLEVTQSFRTSNIVVRIIGALVDYNQYGIRSHDSAITRTVRQTNGGTTAKEPEHARDHGGVEINDEEYYTAIVRIQKWEFN